MAIAVVCSWPATRGATVQRFRRRPTTWSLACCGMPRRFAMGGRPGTSSAHATGGGSTSSTRSVSWPSAAAMSAAAFSRVLDLRLLDRGRDADALLRGDQVVVVVEAGVELYPAHAAVEAARAAGVVVTDGRAGVIAHVAGLVAGVDHRHRALDTALANHRAVDVERDGAALAEPSAVVGELHPHLVGADRHGRLGLDVEASQSGEVVAVLRLAVVEVEGPAGERAALGDDHPGPAAVGDVDVGGHRVRLVLEVDDRVLAQAAHPPVEDLGLALDEDRSTREVGVEALDPAVVERQHVVLDGLDQPKALKLRELVGVLSGEVVRLRPVGVGVVELPDVG